MICALINLAANVAVISFNVHAKEAQIPTDALHGNEHFGNRKMGLSSLYTVALAHITKLCQTLVMHLVLARASLRDVVVSLNSAVESALRHMTKRLQGAARRIVGPDSGNMK